MLPFFNQTTEFQLQQYVQLNKMLVIFEIMDKSGLFFGIMLTTFIHIISLPVMDENQKQEQIVDFYSLSLFFFSFFVFF